MCGYSAFRLGGGSFMDSEVQEVSEAFEAYKGNTSLWLPGGVFLSWI